jgi:hypothetical protein
VVGGNKFLTDHGWRDRRPAPRDREVDVEEVESGEEQRADEETSTGGSAPGEEDGEREPAEIEGDAVDYDEGDLERDRGTEGDSGTERDPSDSADDRAAPEDGAHQEAE